MYVESFLFIECKYIPIYVIYPIPTFQLHYFVLIHIFPLALTSGMSKKDH